MNHDFPEVHGVQHRFVTIGTHTFHYAEAGEGEPLLLLHGWPQHWYMWRHQIPQLAQRFRVICPDMRGFGWSDAPRDGYEKEQLARDVISLMDAIGVKHFRLMAHDWGGWVGFLVCFFHPQRVTRYLALNIPHLYQKLDSRVLTWWRFWYQSVIATPWLGYLLIRGSWLVRLILNLGVRHHQWSEEELRSYVARLKEPERAEASVHLYRTFLLREAIPTNIGRYRSYRLSVPTLILFGTGDFFISPKLLNGYEPYTDSLSVELVPDCGHFIAEEQPELVTKRALEFFGR